ncbi:MmgE/PrpD family protein [Pinirhizobacter sp.]|jgi:2-methylcitrate dehydratase PrpD|uniref:MmgE/PrpD family protein n=1 Tax=Pinirhizobacter sp. TaxID=2950432 RepID=UPI002F41BCB7
MTTKPANITEQAARFIEDIAYDDLPTEALAIGRRCILDAMGLYVAGADESSVRMLIDDAREQGGREDALLVGAGMAKVPAPLAARVLGTAGHAHDWDDTQVSHDPAHIYGLLTHPTVPPLTAALVTAQRIGNVSGRGLMVAFQAGFEVECKISEWMLPDHYLRGHHSSGTVGTFGACAAASKLLGLHGAQLRHALGMAASFAAGIRCNFGTMTKPLHVGRAAENGVTAALLAARGFTADPSALDGRWGFAQVLAGGFTDSKLEQGFGNTFTIVSPGVSIKPYPSGILTHQSMDAMLKLVTTNDVRPDEVASIVFHAGSNILNPIRYPIAMNHLQAKFSMAALLAMMVVHRRAGRREFTDESILADDMQSMQRRITVQLDPAIEAMGFDLIRSRIELTTHDGRTLVQWADERYRGGPNLPMSDDEVAQKFRDCTDGLLDATRQDTVIATARDVTGLADAGELARCIATDG